jgi:hypothetical protein
MRPEPAAGPATDLAPELAEELALHCLAWLTAGCAVGVLLAGLLAWPQGTRSLHPHLRPLVAGTSRSAALWLDSARWSACCCGSICRDRRESEPAASLSRPVGALGASAIALLAGRSSGKLFLD